MRRYLGLLVVMVCLGVLSMATGQQPRAGGRAAPAAGEAAGPVRTRIEQADVTYANYVRMTGTPEEVIIDFGFNDAVSGAPAEGIAIDERVVVTFYTAKKMLAALNQTIERHEAAFGEIETDVQKRVVDTEK